MNNNFKCEKDKVVLLKHLFTMQKQYYLHKSEKGKLSQMLYHHKYINKWTKLLFMIHYSIPIYTFDQNTFIVQTKLL